MWCLLKLKTNLYMNDVNYIMSINKSEKHAADARTKLLNIKSRLETALREIEDCVEVEQTGQMVLLKKDKDTFKCVSIWKEDTWPEDNELEWDLCLPIPDPKTVPEFQGW